MEEIVVDFAAMAQAAHELGASGTRFAQQAAQVEHAHTGPESVTLARQRVDELVGAAAAIGSEVTHLSLHLYGTLGDYASYEISSALVFEDALAEERR